MKNITRTVIFLILATGALAAESKYTILGVTEAINPSRIGVNGTMRSDCPKRLEVKIRASEDTPSDKVFVKVYFYDKNKVLIYKIKNPGLTWHAELKTELRIPGLLNKNSVNMVYFGITPEVIQRFPKATLIVFGDSSSCVVKTINSVNPMDYDFPEKSRVVQAK